MTTWTDVEKYFESSGAKCEACIYFHSWFESHPYGMGSAEEHLCECQLGKSKDDMPSDCPGCTDEPEEEE